MQFEHLKNKSQYKLSKTWFPKSDLIKLVYEGHSHFHGLSHVLRVWLLSFILSRYYSNSNPDIITAAALFHDIGRQRDFLDHDHGSKSGDWIEEYIPLISDAFTKTQITEIIELCHRHDEHTDDNLSFNLKILKDADALDRWRLPLGRLDENRLRLPYSRKLVEFSENLYNTWRKYQSTNQDPIKTLRFTAKKLRIYEYLPLCVKEQLTQTRSQSIKNELDLSEHLISKIDTVTDELWHKLMYGKLKYDSLTNIKNFLYEIDNSNFNSSFLKNIVIIYAKTKLSKILHRALFDYTYPESMQDLIKELYEIILDQKLLFMYPTDEKFLYRIAFRQRKDTNCRLFDALKYHLIKSDRYSKLLLLYRISNTKYPKIVDQIFHPTLSQSTYGEFQIPNTKQLKNDPKLWLEITQYYIRQAQFHLFKGKAHKSQKILQDTVDIITEIFNEVNTEIPDYVKATQQLISIVNISRRSLNNEIPKKIANIWTQHLKYLKLVPKFPQGKIAFYANLFNLYDEIRPQIDKLEEKQLALFKNLAKTEINIDSIIANYILPLVTNNCFSNFDLFTLTHFKKAVCSDTVHKYLESWQETLRNNYYLNSEQQHILNHTSRNSKKHTAEILDKLSIESNVNTQSLKLDDFKVIMNIPGIEVLQNIAKEDAQLLSIWNLLGVKEYTNALTKTIFLKNFKTRTFYRDSVQRKMNIRFPNSSCKHGIYGSLENINNLINIPADEPDEQTPLNYIDKVLHYPMYTFMKTHYGDMTLVFNDEVKTRSIFIFLDSFWKFRNLFVDFEHAAFLKFILSNSLINLAIKTSPLCLGTAYIETVIFGKTTLEDVEKIIIPDSIFENNEILIHQILDKYPHIEAIVK